MHMWTSWKRRRLAARFLSSPTETALALDASERLLLFRGILEGEIRCSGMLYPERLLVLLLSHHTSSAEILLLAQTSHPEVPVGRILRQVLSHKEGKERALFFGHCLEVGVGGALPGTSLRTSDEETREARYHRRLYQLAPGTGETHAALWERIENLPEGHREIFHCLLVSSDGNTSFTDLLSAATSL